MRCASPDRSLLHWIAAGALLLFPILAAAQQAARTPRIGLVGVTPGTYAERKIDDYVTEWIDKVDGRITGQGRKIVSMDGKTLTITVDGSPNLRIYDRQ